jgi:S-methylmethionine-dependent homocysteine/selenocysteine methylase
MKEYFTKFKKIIDIYMPDYGEGETKASQIVTAVSNLIYKFYINGDVFDNTYHLDGDLNDISSYANWLYEYVNETDEILLKISNCYNYNDYENLLKELADLLLNEAYLDEQNQQNKIGSIYHCNGNFKFNFK